MSVYKLAYPFISGDFLQLSNLVHICLVVLLWLELQVHVVFLFPTVHQPAPRQYTLCSFQNPIIYVDCFKDREKAREREREREREIEKEMPTFLRRSICFLSQAFWRCWASCRSAPPQPHTCKQTDHHSTQHLVRITGTMTYTADRTVLTYTILQVQNKKTMRHADQRCCRTSLDPTNRSTDNVPHRPRRTEHTRKHNLCSSCWFLVLWIILKAWVKRELIWVAWLTQTKNGVHRVQ